MKVVITGSSGMVGQGVLQECIESDAVKEILLVNRIPIKLSNPKIKEVLVENFFELDTAQTDLQGYDACYFCIGTSVLGKTEEVYSRITYELTVNFAAVFISHSPNSVFCYVTGQGTDSTEKGKGMWARVKGKTENTILNMGFKAAYMFRPNYIQPMKGVKSKTWYSLIFTFFSPIYLVLKHFLSLATNSENIGLAMIKLTEGKHPVTVFGK
jgi:uncharacterized protein YbjT (DUF2867 family)|tara:strand:+ start:366 stop:1001 length:636 start_codon:yes stop_codon:yes gene_type:complete